MLGEIFLHSSQPEFATTGLKQASKIRIPRIVISRETVNYQTVRVFEKFLPPTIKFTNDPGFSNCPSASIAPFPLDWAISLGGRSAIAAHLDRIQIPANSS